jgi:hypothetical protein
MTDNREQGHRSTLIVMAIVFMCVLAMCSGCSTTVPVTAKFPDAPRLGLGTCPQLQTVEDGVKLSELTKTVVVNYSTYYECAVKADQWNEWYNIQKSIFEKVK